MPNITICLTIVPYNWVFSYTLAKHHAGLSMSKGIGDLIFLVSNSSASDFIN